MITKERLQEMIAEADEALGKFSVAYKELQQEDTQGLWGVYENIKVAIYDWQRIALNETKSKILQTND